MQISNDHNRELVAITIWHTVEFPEGNWSAQCGFHASETEIDIVFNVTDHRLGGKVSEVYVECFSIIKYNRWHTIRLTVETDTMTFSCLIDGELIGSYTPENVAEVQAARFEQTIFNLRDPGATGTMLLDDFRMLP